MKPILLACVLNNGTRLVLHMLAPSSCAAIVQAFDTFPGQVRSCSARPAIPRTATRDPRKGQP